MYNIYNIKLNIITLKGSYDVAKKNIIWCSATWIFTKLIILKNTVCSDWPAIQCVVIGRIPEACD